MKLTATEISSRLAADFGGNLLFQPLAITDGETQRPVALLASVAQLLPLASQMPDRASALRERVFDLLHHDPVSTIRAKR